MSMKAEHFSAATGRPIETHEVRSCVVGFCSWKRLAEVYRAAGELKEGETIESFQVDERGISIRVVRVKA
jgi:hypothetical protein